MTTHRTILAKTATEFLTREADAGGAISPGMLVSMNSDGEYIAHATAGGNAAPMFAVEDYSQGNGVDDDYAEDDQVIVVCPKQGESVNARIANGENIAIGDFLCSNGDGYLKKFVYVSEAVEYPSGLVGFALEAIDMSGSSGVDPSSDLIEVQVM